MLLLRISFIAILLSLSGVYAFGQNWTSLPTCCEGVLLVIDSTTLLKTNGHIIYKTTDQGDNWKVVFENESTLDDFGDLSINSEGRIYAVHDRFNTNWSGFLYSDDLGETWNKSFAFLYNPYVVYFLNNDVGFVGSSEANLYKTIDGGLTWKRVLSKQYSNFKTISFINDSIGFAGGGRINQSLKFMTTDGGETWGPAFIPGNHIKKIDFPTPDVGYAVGNNRVSKTIDGGKTWNSLTLPVSEFFGQICFPTELNGFVTTVDYLESTGGWYAGSRVFYTNDGGLTWTEQFTDDPQLYEVFNIDYFEDVVFMSGIKYGFYKTSLSSIMDPVSISEQQLDVANIYPNPSSQQIFIEGWEEFEYALYSIEGNLINQGFAKESVNIEDLNSGLHFIKIKKGRESFTGKFLKI